MAGFFDERIECGNCRELNEPEATHCWNCNADLRKAYKEEANPKEKAKEEKLAKYLPIALYGSGSAVLVLVAILIFHLFT